MAIEKRPRFRKKPDTVPHEVETPAQRETRIQLERLYDLYDGVDHTSTETENVEFPRERPKITGHHKRREPSTHNKP
jgi:hypothetical protein